MIRRIRGFWGAMALSIHVAGCVVTGVLDQNVEVGANESLFVMGVTPRNYFAIVRPTGVENGAVKSPSPALAKVMARPTDGYVMWKGDTNQLFHLAQVQFHEHENHTWGPDILPCGDVTTRVYSSGGKKVVYLGNVEFSRDGDAFKETFSDRFDAAQKYVDQRFPLLRGRLERGQSQVVQISRPCVTPVPIIVPVIRGR